MPRKKIKIKLVNVSGSIGLRNLQLNKISKKICKSINSLENNQLPENFFFLSRSAIPTLIETAFVDTKTIISLNKKYGKINKSTDVLSFSLFQEAKRNGNNESKDSEKKEMIFISNTHEPVISGQIIICLEKAKKNAKNRKWTLNQELEFLITHGILHILGYDHKIQSDFQKMFAAHKKIMPTLEIEDFEEG